MSKNVIVITASPRPGSNSAALAMTKGDTLCHALSQTPSGFAQPGAINSCPRVMPQAWATGFSSRSRIVNNVRMDMCC